MPAIGAIRSQNNVKVNNKHTIILPSQIILHPTVIKPLLKAMCSLRTLVVKVLDLVLLLQDLDHQDERCVLYLHIQNMYK